MKTKEIIIIIIAMILAYFVTNILWVVARFLVQTAFFLLIAYIVYIFLRKYINEY